MIRTVDENIKMEQTVDIIDATEIIQQIIANQEIYDELRNVNIKSNLQNNNIFIQHYASTPTLPKPPKPKSPLELLEDFKSGDIKIIINGKEIEYKTAKKLIHKNNYSRIDFTKQEGRPVLKLWNE